MKVLHRRRAAVALAAAVPALLVFALSGTASAKPRHHSHHHPRIDHVVVIYEENHSFDNLFGGWERVNGLAHASAQEQVAPDGTVLPCLPQTDANLTSPPLPVPRPAPPTAPPPPPPLPAPCRGTVNGTTNTPAFTNAPFTIDDYIKPTDTTCP